MTFMQETIASVQSIWDECANATFLSEMASGTLSKKKFFDYMVQDSIYLRGYLKEFAFAITKSNTLKEMQLYFSLLRYIDDGENATRLNYLRECNMTDADVDKISMRPQCKAYVDFLYENAINGTQEDILMATMPCMIGYNYVFEKFKNSNPHIVDGYYGPLVNDYANDEYHERCQFMMDIIDEKVANLSNERKAQLREIFKQASLHELYFWQMAGENT